MTLEAHTYSAPAYWASYLVNGDSSGLEPEEIRQVDQFIAEIVAEIGNGHCVDATDQGFAFDYNTGLYGDLCEYTFLA